MNDLELDFTGAPEHEEALEIIKKLQQQGYQAVYAGGCVRDVLLGLCPKDIDIATDAKPEAVLDLFDKGSWAGKNFGVVRIIIGTHSMEVATFRKDGSYENGRHPDTIEYASMEEDAFRRDFTMNALFYDPVRGELFDYVGGHADIKNKKIRAVGDAEERFLEDHLRILRALRFASRLGFELETNTAQSLRTHNLKIKSLAHERVREEFVKVAGTKSMVGFVKLLMEYQLMEVWLPGWLWDYKADLLGVSWSSLAHLILQIENSAQESVVSFWCVLLLHELRLNCFINDKEQKSVETLFEQSIKRLSFLCFTKSEKKSLLRFITFGSLCKKRDSSEKLGGALIALMRHEDYGFHYSFWAEEHKRLKRSFPLEIKHLTKAFMPEGVLPEPLYTGKKLIRLGVSPGPALGLALSDLFEMQLRGQIDKMKIYINDLTQ